MNYKLFESPQAFFIFLVVLLLRPQGPRILNVAAFFFEKYYRLLIIFHPFLYSSLEYTPRKKRRLMRILVLDGEVSAGRIIYQGLNAEATLAQKPNQGV